MDFVDEQNSRHELGNALIDVTIHNFVNLTTKLIRDFRLFALRELTHERLKIIAALWVSVGHIEIMERYLMT